MTEPSNPAPRILAIHAHPDDVEFQCAGTLALLGEAGCAVWPVPPTRTVGPVAAPGSPPILVVGTTNDPATPYAWAVSVAKELDRGVLLTHDGDQHVAYFYSACVRADVQTYLVSGQTPPPGTTCPS